MTNRRRSKASRDRARKVRVRARRQCQGGAAGAGRLLASRPGRGWSGHARRGRRGGTKKERGGCAATECHVTLPGVQRGSSGHLRFIGAEHGAQAGEVTCLGTHRPTWSVRATSRRSGREVRGRTLEPLLLPGSWLWDFGKPTPAVCSPDGDVTAPRYLSVL